MVRKVFGIAGAMLIASGLLALAFVGFVFFTTYQTCQGGNSPQPDQGCGYILNPAFWLGDPLDATLTFGFVAVTLGIFCSIVALASRFVRSQP